ncbi:MAG: hypothetical protein WBP79_07490, partial [Candidatus Acidiferrales bacterium]
LFQIGLEFEVPGNVWGIAFPPEDWAAPEADQAPEIPAPGALTAAPEPSAYAQSHPVMPPSSAPEIKPEASATHPASAAPAAPTVPASPATPAAHTPPAAEAKIHLMPPPSQDAQLAIAKQMAKMVADAKETLDKTMRRGAETAIAEEMSIARQQLDAQLHETVERAIKNSMDRVSESAVKKVVQEASERTSAIVDEARKASDASAGQLDAKVRDAVQNAVSHAAEQAAQQAAQHAAAVNVKQAVEEAVDRALTEREASTPSLGILSSPEAAQQHLDKWRKDLEETAHSVRNQTIELANADASGAAKRWQEEFETALSGASQKIGEKLGEVSKTALTHAEQEVAERSASLRASLDEVIAGAQATIESLGSTLSQDRARAEEVKSQLEGLSQSTIDETRHRLTEILSTQSETMGRKADEVISQRVEKLGPQIEASAGKIVVRISSELEEKLAPRLEEVQQALTDLATAQQQATNLEQTVREQVQKASEQAALIQNTFREQVEQVSQQAVEESLAKLKQETAKLPAEVEKSSREVVAKFEEELQQRSTETQHATYEALLKASDWYQKKAQTTMHSSLEKAVEQSTTALRDRAAEISSMLASELDHYRRTYVEHSQAQIEDAAKEVVDRERGKLHETAEMTRAGFTDQVNRVTTDSLRRFEESSRDALEKARSDMEYNREGSLVEYQKKLDDRLMQGVEQARTQLLAQIGPMMEAWEEKREAEQKQWLEALRRSTDESIEQYKGRLENASNSWLLASATTLGQHSQAVLDTLAKSAEKRIRETCADVLAGMGDTIKDRLMGISSGISKEEDEEPHKKKP